MIRERMFVAEKGQNCLSYINNYLPNRSDQCTVKFASALLVSSSTFLLCFLKKVTLPFQKNVLSMKKKQYKQKYYITKVQR